MMYRRYLFYYQGPGTHRYPRNNKRGEEEEEIIEIKRIDLKLGLRLLGFLLYFFFS